MNRRIVHSGSVMSVSKFGASLKKRDDGKFALERLKPSIDSLRNYVRDNALCSNADIYDAKERKIRRLATPENDSDATNKNYVESALRVLRDETIKLREQTEKSVTNVEKTISEYEKRLMDVKKNAESIERALKLRTNTLMDEIKRNRSDLEQIIVDKLEKNTNEFKKSNGTLKRETGALKKSVTEQATQLVNVQTAVKKIIETLEEKINSEKVVNTAKITPKNRETQKPSTRVITVSDKVTGNREAEQVQLRELYDLLGIPK